MNASSAVTSGFVSALALTLLHTLWQGAVAAGLLWAALKMIPVARSRLRYAAACGSLLLVTAAGGLTLNRYCRDFGRGTAAASPPAITAPPGLAASASVSAAAAPDSLGRSGTRIPPASPATSLGSSGAVSNQLMKVITPNLPPQTSNAGQAPTGSAPVSANRRNHVAGPQHIQFSAWMSWLVGLWAAGVLTCLLRLWAEWRVLRQWRKQAGRCPEGPWNAAFDQLLARLRLSQSIRLLTSVTAPVPMVIGWVRPVVLMPAELLAGLPLGQTEALLAHELAHIRRWDFLVNLLQSAVQILFFHHPAVHWISSQIRAEREHCCDDTAARLCGGPLPYARALAALEELRSAGAASSPRLCPAATGSPLVRRIRRLVAPSTAVPPISPLWPALATVTALVLVLAGLPWLNAQEQSTSSRPEGPTTSSAAAPAEKPASLPTPRDAAVATANPAAMPPADAASATQAEAQTARAQETVNAFLSASTTADKLRGLLPDEETQSAALAFYHRHPEMAKAMSGTQFGPAITNGSGEVTLAMEIPVLEGCYFFLVRPTAPGPRIDWLSSTVYLRQRYEDIRTDMLETSVRIRAMMVQGDYYNKAFSDKARYHCYELIHPGLDRKFYGYERVLEPASADTASDATGSPPAALAGLNLNLRPGVQTIEIKYPASQKDPSQVEIMRVLPKPAILPFVPQPHGAKQESLRAETTSEFGNPAVQFDSRGFGDDRLARLRDFGAAAFNEVSLSLPAFAPPGERKPLPPQFTMAVTEAGSGKRIPKFRLIVGRSMPDGKMLWGPPYPGADGVIPIDPQGLPDTGGVRVEAEGKIPQALFWGNKEQRPEIIPFELQADPGIKCRILLPDGNAAAGASVAIAISGYSAKLEDGRFSNFTKAPEEADAKGFDSRSPRFCQADANGDFLLPAEIEPSALVIAVHDGGILEMPYINFVTQRNVKIIPWAAVEGKVVWQEILGPDIPITLQVSRGSFAGEMLSQRLTVTSGMDGSFSFSKVPPGRIYLQWQMTAVPDRVSRSFEFVARPGSNAFLIGGEGRTVTGQLTGLPSWEGFSLAIEPWDASQPAPGQGIPTDAWRTERAAWAFIRQTSLGRCYFKENIRVESDGQFEIPDVLPEFYHLILTPPAGTGPAIHCPNGFRVEPETGGNSPPRLKLGLVSVSQKAARKP